MIVSQLSYFNSDEKSKALVIHTINSLPSYEIDSVDEYDNTLLQLSIMYQAHEAFLLLLEKGAEVNHRNSSKEPPQMNN